MLYFILAAVLVVIDQAVKLWVRSAIPLGEIVPFLPGVMNLTFVQNTGAAFSSFSNLTWLLSLISLAASVLIVVLMVRNYFPGRLGKVTLSLLLSGAVGNLIDRVFLGYVTDMFDTVLPPFQNFAVFNVADICVVVGGVLMVIYVLVFWDKDREKANLTAKEEHHDPS